MAGVYTKKHVEDVFDTSEEALPFRLQQIAEDELGETPARRKESLAKLLQLLSGMWVLNESSYVDVHRAMMVCLEYLAKDPTTQTLGVVLLFDYGGFTADKVLAVNVGLIRRAFEYLQISLTASKIATNSAVVDEDLCDNLYIFFS
ncbi:hypothetical protein HPB51_021783 [Rhipicephalus microplus]|uniref:Uncharacterized protein n=1 Tax=Rhipicephalus microplus TaxID=6941 RepID=A0A9J6DQM1_RHIMP|nr:hypothetical protein HPB51_021783 [Rhipicephalus microplus]